MKVILDANILLRAAESESPDHRPALDALKALRRRGDELRLVPQSLYEFWTVSTRPIDKNGRGKTPDQVAAEVTYLKSDFPLFPDVPDIFAEWERLVVTHKVSGKPSHDARYVAAMLVHGVTHILTFNDADFRRFPEVTVLTPAAVLAAPP
jgi:predicted nucleic acid-binding protein